MSKNHYQQKKFFLNEHKSDLGGQIIILDLEYTLYTKHQAKRRITKINK